MGFNQVVMNGSNFTSACSEGADIWGRLNGQDRSPIGSMLALMDSADLDSKEDMSSGENPPRFSIRSAKETGLDYGDSVPGGGPT